MGLLKGSSGCGRKEPFTSGEEWQINARLSRRTTFPHCDTATGHYPFINPRAISAMHALPLSLVNHIPKNVQNLRRMGPRQLFCERPEWCVSKRQSVAACRT